MIQSKARKGGFTLIELLVVVSIIGLLIGILLPALSRAKKQAQQVKDSAQVREIHRGLVSFAQNNRDRFPVPSIYDKVSNTEGPGTAGQQSTTAQIGAAEARKNRTGAIMSILIYNGTVTTEQCVSPAEAEGQIRKDPDFQFGDISQSNASDKSLGLWDPGFVGSGSKVGDLFVPPTSADPTNVPDNPIANQTNVCNNSYAWQPYYGNRRGGWSTNYSASDPVMGNRGPNFLPASGAATNPAVYPLAPGPQGTTSTTLLIHGGKKTWEGNYVYNDGHVQAENSPAPSNLKISYAPGGAAETLVQDNLFYDEEWEGPGGLQSHQRSNYLFRQWPTGFNTSTANTNLKDASTWDGKTGATNDWLSS